MVCFEEWARTTSAFKFGRLMPRVCRKIEFEEHEVLETAKELDALLRETPMMRDFDFSRNVVKMKDKKFDVETPGI